MAIPAETRTDHPTLRIIDALDHPHGGRILRVRVDGGNAPSLRSLRGSRLRAVAPDGSERVVRVTGFPLMGGKPSDARIRDTGRVDLLVEMEGEGPPVSRTWRLITNG